MCYKINEHHLTHDVRPRLTYSGHGMSAHLVNPYAVPKPCCAQDASIAKWFVCPYGHGCCYLMSRIVICTDYRGLGQHCGAVTDYHTYGERVPQVEDKTWLPVPSLEEDIGRPENSDKAFQPHQEAFWELNSEMEDLTQVLDQLEDDYSATKDVYDALENGWRCDSHDICERVLQPHECREFALQTEMREVQDKLEAMERVISALEVRFALRRLRFDAVGFGFTGVLDLNWEKIVLGE